MIRKRNVIGNFENNSILLLVCGAFSSIMGFLYQIILGNVLSVENYGKANIITTYISTVTMFIYPISLLASRNVAIYKAEQKEQELNDFLAVIFEIITIVCVIICLFTFGFESIKQENAGNLFYMACMAITLVTNIVYNVFLYVVQGFKQFGRYGFVGLMYAVVKVAVVIVTRRIQSVYIVMFSLAVANIICIMILLCPNKQDSIMRKYEKQDIKGWIPKILPFYGWTFLAQLLLCLIYNGGDVILVKYAFSDAMSGVYAVASNLCRAAIIGVSPILSIMYTEVASNLGNKSTLKKLLNKSLMYCSLLAGLFLIVLNIVGEWIVNVLYGVRYAEAIRFLPKTAFLIMSVVWLNILSQYCMALGKVKMLAVTIVFIIIGILSQTLIMATVEQMIVAAGIIIYIGNIPCYYGIIKSIKKQE